MSTREFKDKVVIVTGSGRGIGRAIALAFAAAGGIVAVNDQNPDNAVETVKQILTAGGRAKDYIGDISKKMTVQMLVNEIEDDWGGIHYLINNAAVKPHKPLLEMDEWDWRRTIEVNLTGPFVMTQVVARVMLAQGTGGVIVNIGGSAENREIMRGLGAYLASKAGIRDLTRVAALELAPHKIRVSAVCFRQMKFDGQLSEIAEKVLFLCGQEAADISGQVIEI